MFRGRYQHTIDPKGRLSVPAKFRDTLAQYDGALVVVPNEHCLEVHPLEEWQRIETKLREQSIFNPEVRELGRLYVSRAKDATLVGGGLPQFEVWDRSRFEEYERTRAERLPTLFERLSGLGV